MTGQLFTHYFLTDGIKTTPEWQASVDQPEAFAAFRNGVARHHSALSRSQNPNEMAPFARDLGYDGEPFIWDEEERRHLRARLDALYFDLYGLSRTDAEYVLNTFPIVRREDEAAFGKYRTRDMTLAYMNALAAGDTEAAVAV